MTVRSDCSLLPAGGIAGESEPRSGSGVTLAPSLPQVRGDSDSVAVPPSTSQPRPDERPRSLTGAAVRTKGERKEVLHSRKGDSSLLNPQPSSEVKTASEKSSKKRKSPQKKKTPPPSPKKTKSKESAPPAAADSSASAASGAGFAPFQEGQRPQRRSLSQSVSFCGLSLFPEEG